MESNDSIYQLQCEFHTYGKYLQGLKRIASNDSTLLDYIKAKELAGDISPALFLEGVLSGTFDKVYVNPIFKRVVVIELYFDLMEWDAHR